MAVRHWTAMPMVVPIQATEILIQKRVAMAFRRGGLRGRVITTIMGRLTPGYTQSPCSRLWRKLQPNQRELKTLAPVFMKQECHADRTATKHVDLDGWREEVKGETPQVVEETPEEFIRHMLSPVSGPLWKAVSTSLGWTEGRAKALIDFGGVYYKTEDAPATARPKRERNPHREVKEGEYLRIFPDPRRYPVCHEVDWDSAIVYEAEEVMLVNKPAGVPAHATVDNFHENMLGGLRVSRPEIEAFLPHRLDIDTSGLVIVTKNLETLRVINGILKEPGLELQTGDRSRRARRAKRKELQKEAFAVAALRGKGTRVSGAFDGAEAKAKPLAVCLRKRYRALVEVLPGSLPLRASATAPLTHFQKVAPRAPKMFSRTRPPQEGVEGAEAASWIECRMLVLSARDASPPPEVRDFRRDPGVVEDRHGVKDRRFQEIEVELLTGRTHQIRGQLAAEGCPIYGDLLYRQGVALQHDEPPPPSPPQEASVDHGNLDSDGSDRGVLGSDRSGACRRGERPERFVNSPGLALQAHHVSIELGDGVQHAATLGRDTCWWAIDAIE